MLKAEVAGIGFPEKGTPQGGIISPLLSNIVLNELDWWVASQWENIPTRENYIRRIYANGTPDKSKQVYHLRKTALKECYIVRYADDFKIFCRTKEDAEKTYYAVKDWLWKRLKLEVSDEKSKVTNLRKRDSEFLGFRIKLRRKSNLWVITSNVCDKAIHRISKEMADSVKAIQSSKTAEEISLNVGDYNAKVIGVQDYYCIATRVNLNFSNIARPINGQLLHLQVHLFIIGMLYAYTHDVRMLQVGREEVKLLIQVNLIIGNSCHVGGFAHSLVLFIFASEGLEHFLASHNLPTVPLQISFT